MQKKKIILFILLINFSLSNHIFTNNIFKTNRHTYTVGGDLKLPEIIWDESGYKVTTLYLNPQFGYFIIDNLMLNISFSFEKNLYASIPDIQVANPLKWGAGLGFTYVFNNLNKSNKIIPFINLEVGFLNKGLEIILDNNPEININSKLGAIFPLSKNVGVTFGANFNVEYLLNKASYKIKYKLTPEFGIIYFI